MNPGELVVNNFGGSYLPMYHEIHGIFVSEYHRDEIGIVINLEYSNTDVPYVQILTSHGKVGWVRYEKVKVLR